MAACSTLVQVPQDPCFQPTTPVTMCWVGVHAVRTGGGFSWQVRQKGLAQPLKLWCGPVKHLSSWSLTQLSRSAEHHCAMLHSHCSLVFCRMTSQGEFCARHPAILCGRGAEHMGGNGEGTLVAATTSGTDSAFWSSGRARFAAAAAKGLAPWAMGPVGRCIVAP